MPPRLQIICALLLSGLLTACASGEVSAPATSNDGGPEDQDVAEADAGDTGPDADADTGPAFEPPEFYHSTSGGGLSTSNEFRMQMNFGAPMPRGTSENDEYRIHFGPVSP